jgi:membrane protein
LAFSLFVCIVPFVLIIFFVVGKVLEAAAVQEPLEFLIDTIIPYEGQASFVKRTLFSRTAGITWRKGIYGMIGVFGLLFTASGLFSSMRTILNTVYRVKEEPRIPIWGKVRDFGMVFLVLFVFLVAITILPILEAFKDSAIIAVTFVEVFDPSGLQKFLYLLGTGLLLFGSFAVLYSLVPYGKRGKKVILMSALWATLLWETAKQIFGYYINHFASIERIYGAYVLMVIVAFWIFYSSVIFILGAEIGQLYCERKALCSQADG